MDLVTIITATIGRPELARCIESVKAQTHKNIQHLIVVDGHEHKEKVDDIVSNYDDLDVVYLPYPTKQWGGRVYGSMPHIAKGDFIENLDDDNFLELNHVETMLSAIKDAPWAFCFRNLYIGDKFFARDDCESLGPLHSTWEAIAQGKTAVHVDTSCYFFRRSTAIAAATWWAPKEAFSDQNYYNDRTVLANVLQHYPQCRCSMRYTVNYSIPENKVDYFQQSNAAMHQHYNGQLPWANLSRASTYLRRGIWTLNEAKNEHHFDKPLAEAILQMFPTPPRSCADLGCGPGFYCDHFSKAGWKRVSGYEGTEDAAKLGVYGKIQQLDLSILNESLPIHPFVMSLEVGEHIPKEFENNFIRNVSAMTEKTLILSWAVPGQGGYGHFNERPNEYVIQKFNELGLTFDPVRSQILREAATLAWFKNTLMVFEREKK